ncbi:MAG: ECF transporter S component [Tindallia sp. MSAO_Bac2]|nr:MAG: ECF transporter S component [Tindallia sp. MSAO_Bac2]
MKEHSLTSTKDLTIVGLLAALVAVATMMITIPVPATEGFIHLGDAVIFFAAVFFGRKKGALSAGIGSAMADLLLGYTVWILPTLMVKSIMGYIVGSFGEKSEHKPLSPVTILGLVIGAIWMVSGYLAAGSIIKGSFAVGLTGVPWDMVQGFGGIVLYIPVAVAINKTRFFQQGKMV